MELCKNKTSGTGVAQYYALGAGRYHICLDASAGLGSVTAKLQRHYGASASDDGDAQYIQELGADLELSATNPEVILEWNGTGWLGVEVTAYDSKSVTVRAIPAAVPIA